VGTASQSTQAHERKARREVLSTGEKRTRGDDGPREKKKRRKTTEKDDAGKATIESKNEGTKKRKGQVRGNSGVEKSSSAVLTSGLEATNDEVA